MLLRYVLDEHLRGPLWHTIRQHNAAGAHLIDVVRVGDPPDLPLGSKDPDILLWAEREGRVLVTEDRGTMATHLASHLQAGHHSPGVFFLRPNWGPTQVVFHLALAAYAGDPGAIQDRFDFIP
jgi:hypothetical protein